MSRPVSSRSSPSRLLAVDESILRHDWYIQLVVGNGNDDPEGAPVADLPIPLFAFTVGLTRHLGHPEIITFGLCMQHSGLSLDLLGNAVAEGRDVTDPAALDELFGDANARMLDVSGSALLRASVGPQAAGSEPPAPTLQLVWSDNSGRFPWQRGYHGSPTQLSLLGEAA